MIKDAKFYTGSGHILDFDTMVTELKEFMTNDNSQVIIGSDSQRIPKKGGFSFVTVICCLDSGKGGHYYYWKKKRSPHRNMSVQGELAWKMWTEAEDITTTINSLTQAGLDLNGVLTHHDLSVNGKSSKHIKGIIGLMKSYGYIPEIKPNAFVASSVADKHSH